MLAAWIAGFALYQWLQPVGPSWWTDALGDGAGLDIGATLPSFAVSVALGLAVATLGRRRSRGGGGGGGGGAEFGPVTGGPAGWF